MPTTKNQPSVMAGRVLREMLLLGKRRGYNDPLTAEEIAAIPGPGLRAMVEARDIELLGDLESTAPGREIALLSRELADLRKRIETLEARPEPKLNKPQEA